MTLDWGDVPSWIGVALTIAIPAVAYFERNRIAGFFRRKTTEPLPALPPARFNLVPRPEGGWVLVNGGLGEAFNVRLDVEDSSAAIVTSGFWETFLEESYGTVEIRLSAETRRYGDISPTIVLVSWQDAHSKNHVERIAINSPDSYRHNGKLAFENTAPGKVLPVVSAVKRERSPKG